MFRKNRMNRFVIVCLAVVMLLFTACGQSEADLKETSMEQTGVSALTPKNEKEEARDMVDKMKVQIGEYIFTATLEKNEASSQLVEMMNKEPIVLAMDDYSGFEKVGSLGKTLSRSDKQTVTQSGDIVLYNGNNIVLFYGSNSWSYTRLGKIDDPTNLEKALGSGSVTVTLSVDN